MQLGSQSDLSRRFKLTAQLWPCLYLQQLPYLTAVAATAHSAAAEQVQSSLLKRTYAQRLLRISDLLVNTGSCISLTSTANPSGCGTRVTAWGSQTGKQRASGLRWRN